MTPNYYRLEIKTTHFNVNPRQKYKSETFMEWQGHLIKSINCVIIVLYQRCFLNF